MPLLMILGVIVLLAAVAIFKVSKWQADRYVRLAKKAKEAGVELFVLDDGWKTGSDITDIGNINKSPFIVFNILKKGDFLNGRS